MMNRRQFLETTAVATAATLLADNFSWAAGFHKLDKIGVQLFTLRDAMKTDFDGTIARVAKIGFKEVEFAGYFDRTPKQVRVLLDKNGLTSPACHVPYSELAKEKWPLQIESAKVIGQRYLVNPWIPRELRTTLDGWKQIAATFNRVGEQSQKAKVQFAYHNHWFEFQPVEGKLPYDLLLQECDPKLVKMELDLCWIVVAGADPIKYLEKYKGRFPLVHVKDMKSIPKKLPTNRDEEKTLMEEMTEVGSGVIKWKDIFAKAEIAGIEHFIVEHDVPKMPFESIKTSHDFLRSLRF